MIPKYQGATRALLERASVMKSIVLTVLLKYGCMLEEGKEEGRAVEVYLAQWGMPCSAGLYVKAARV